VLSPVGLLPIAVGGFDIYRLLDGARKMELATGPGIKAENNPSLLYAAARNILFRKNYIIEILANYNPKLHYLTEWWKQLFGESEGKKHTGIFPAGADYTADLHSMGQYIQEGRRNIFETTVSVKDSHISLTIPNDPENSDKLNFLAGKSLQEVTRIAELATSLAHVEGGVPNIRIEMPVLDEYHIGELIYFFEKACGLSGYMMGINPFDQPGVEAYKNNMFALLGKPGYEEIAKKIQKAGITGKK
jgi:glucose-6-phosphate isomerase